ncbi:hypothetical protein DIPPA_28357 [Diplonema papillatum]|nr:hypothetical protein DIPPA_28357 [Diplonema papillatum]
MRVLLVVAWAAAAAGYRAGYGEYCQPAGEIETKYNATLWSEPAACTRESAQDGHLWGTRDNTYEDGYQVVDLSTYSGLFCCKSNYTTLIARNTTVEILDRKARDYQEAAGRVLSRFNCRDFYPYFNCTPCEQAYRSWVCSVIFPRKCRNEPAEGAFGHTQKVCKDVCYDVVRRCPVELEFHCPTDDSYGDWGTDTNWDTANRGEFRGMCNPMQLNLEASANIRPQWLLVSLSLSVALAVMLLDVR